VCVCQSGSCASPVDTAVCPSGFTYGEEGCVELGPEGLTALVYSDGSGGTIGRCPSEVDPPCGVPLAGGAVHRCGTGQTCACGLDPLPRCAVPASSCTSEFGRASDPEECIEGLTERDIERGAPGTDGLCADADGECGVTGAPGCESAEVCICNQLRCARSEPECDAPTTAPWAYATADSVDCVAREDALPDRVLFDTSLSCPGVGIERPCGVRLGGGTVSACDGESLCLCDLEPLPRCASRALGRPDCASGWVTTFDGECVTALTAEQIASPEQVTSGGGPCEEVAELDGGVP